MEIEEEVLDAQPEVPAVTITEEEIAELKKRADVSSQNFERAKKAENELKALKEAQLANDGFVPEDTHYTELKEQLNRIEEREALNNLKGQYPVLEDKLTEFNEFRQNYPGVNLESVTKVFLAEKDLLGEQPKRKGLEKAKGGQRTPPSTENSSDDVKRLRENNYREYVKQIREGKIV